MQDSQDNYFNKITDQKQIGLTIILPVYNEKDNLEILFSELKNVLDEINNTVEIIFIDDHSTDGSLEVLESLAGKDSRIKIIKFRKS